MCKKNYNQAAESIDCGQVVPQNAVFALPVMIIVMEKLKLL
jgi:hypothetical protein